MADIDCEYDKQIVKLRKKQIKRIDDQIVTLQNNMDKDIAKIMRHAKSKCDSVRELASNELKQLTRRKRLECWLLDLDTNKPSLLSDPRFPSLSDDINPHEIMDMMQSTAAAARRPLPIQHRLLQQDSSAETDDKMVSIASDCSHWMFNELDVMDMETLDLCKWDGSAEGVTASSSVLSPAGLGTPGKRARNKQRTRIKEEIEIAPVPLVTKRKKVSAGPKPSWEYVPVGDETTQDQCLIMEGKRTRRKKNYDL